MQIKELPSSSTLASNDVLVKETNGGTTQKITGADFVGQVKNIGSLLGTGDVVNNLNSSSSTAPLAAAQGKALNDAKANASDIAIIIDGNQTTHTGGVAIGEFVLVRNSTISGITDGVYTAAQAIPANTAIDSTYLTAVDGGGLNALNSKIAKHTSNTNGDAWQFDSGLMICTKTVDFGTLSFSTAWGSVYETSSQNLGDWAVAFNNTPKMSIVSKGSQSASIEVISNASSTSCGKTTFYRPVSGNASVIIDIIGIGTWK